MFTVFSMQLDRLQLSNICASKLTWIINYQKQLQGKQIHFLPVSYHIITADAGLISGLYHLLVLKTNIRNAHGVC